jgi:RNA-directed DNA polymerase
MGVSSSIHRLAQLMTDRPRTRQELYDRIRESSRDEVILEEMIRLGFWPNTDGVPNDPATEIRRIGEIQRELQELRAQNTQLHNEAALKKQMLKERMAQTRRKRAENKAKREQERLDRSAAWAAQKQTEIVFLGEGVSGGLNHQESNLERLQQNNLPILHNAADLAAALDITVNQLRFLAFNRRASTISHYVRFNIAKKTGGVRRISAPMPHLKKVQQWVLDSILEKVALHQSAHGFRRGRSIVTNAKPHVGAEIVINLDFKDFFPSISYPRVKGLFRALGYSEAVATLLGLLCTEPEVEEVTLDGKTYFVATTERHLPQGAPSSPAITNVLCRRLDRRLSQMAAELGFAYTRYADDLTFSGSVDAHRKVCNILKRTERIVAHEGLTIHPQKTRVLRKSQQQEVTGVVVNQKLNIDRNTLKCFRATLHHIEKDGLAGKQWGQSPDLLKAIEGFANFVVMVNPDKGNQYLEQVQRIKKKYGPRRR